MGSVAFGLGGPSAEISAGLGTGTDVVRGFLWLFACRASGESKRSVVRCSESALIVSPRTAWFLGPPVTLQTADGSRPIPAAAFLSWCLHPLSPGSRCYVQHGSC